MGEEKKTSEALNDAPRELDEEELKNVVGGAETPPPGSDNYKYNREGKCSKCRVVSWWNSRKRNPKACPLCGGSWEYVHKGKF